MFIVLLIITLVIASVMATGVARLFRHSIRAILDRVVSEDLSGAWHRYMVFAIYVVGVSGGVRIWELEKYITGRGPDELPVVLNSNRWVLEIYRTIIQTLQSTAWLLLVFFVFALVAFVILRGFELRRSSRRTE
ncbi:MAG TPA: hypothetical protein VFD07_02025 [Candidatus Krumholzibacteria bacterium]|nr:hypothetical protein [Candidatus Krumholzibacteria bacterium]